MALPSGLATVTVNVGPYVTGDGNAVRGSVRFQPEAPLLHVPSGAKVLDDPVSVTLTAGAGTVTLPASDDPNVVPNPVAYWVFWDLEGVTAPPPRRVLLLASSPTVPLESLLPVGVASSGVVSVPTVTSLAGLSGAVTAQQLLDELGDGIGGGGGVTSLAGLSGVVSAAAALAALGLFVPPSPPSGAYLFPSGSQAAATVNPGNSTLRLVPWLLPRPLSISRIGAEVTAAGQAGSVLRLGVYADDGAGRPGALLIDAGTIPGDAIAVADIAAAITLPAGLLWVGGAAQNAATTQPTVRTTAAPPPVPLYNTSSPAAGATWVGYSITAAGALPALITSAGLGLVGSGPRVHVRVA